MTNNEYTQKMEAALDVNIDLHRKVYEDVLNELARLNDNMFGIFKVPNKAKGNFIINQLRDYESQMKEAAQIKINTLQGTLAGVAECEDKTAVQESIGELQAFIQMLDDTTFNVGKFTTKGKITKAIAEVNINADVIEKVWKCRRFQRNVIITALVAAAVTVGIAYTCVKNNKTKSVLVVDDCGTLNIDFTDQIACDTILTAELHSDADELLESVAI